MSDLAEDQRALCHADEIGEGDARGFLPWPGARRKVIVLRKNGDLHAWLDSCPHYDGGTPMAWKADAYFNADRSRLVCFSHGALFDPETGECVIGACLGKRLRRVPIVEEADGLVRLAEGFGRARDAE